MAKADLTDITVVLDRSGSMSSCKADAEGGLNTFVEEQKKLPGSALYTLVQFDEHYDFVHKGVPLQTVPKFALVPRGSTALLDAVGRAIIETGERLKAMPEAERPGLVAFCIITDGGENSSKEFSREKVKEMIEHQTNAYQWQFTYIGANQDAFAVAGGIGISSGNAANYATAKSGSAFEGTSGKLGRMRVQSLSGQAVCSHYTEQERQAMAPDPR